MMIYIHTRTHEYNDYIYRQIDIYIYQHKANAVKNKLKPNIDFYV